MEGWDCVCVYGGGSLRDPQEELGRHNINMFGLSDPSVHLPHALCQPFQPSFICTLPRSLGSCTLFFPSFFTFYLFFQWWASPPNRVRPTSAWDRAAAVIVPDGAFPPGRGETRAFPSDSAPGAIACVISERNAASSA